MSDCRCFLQRIVCACWLLLFGTPACADEFRAAYLELRQTSAHDYDITWKVPARGEDERLALQVRLPAGAVALTEPHGAFVGNRHVTRWRVQQAGGLEGKQIAVDGLRGGSVEVLVRVERSDGGVQMARLMPSQPSFLIAGPSHPLQVVRTYTLLGVEHILLGVDHLLFVLALLFLVRGGKRIALTITAFTLAHSITLALATIGWLALPSAPVEAVIALSIAFLAREIVMKSRGRTSLTERKPWLVAFGFGLLHGLGFAGALAEIGLPADAIPLALLSFNVGVEIGQGLFVSTALTLAWLVRRQASREAQRWQLLAPHLIGGMALYWLIARVAALGQ